MKHKLKYFDFKADTKFLQQEEKRSFTATKSSGWKKLKSFWGKGVGASQLRDQKLNFKRDWWNL